jgi:hypothetical protein
MQRTGISDGDKIRVGTEAIIKHVPGEKSPSTEERLE